MKTYHGTRLAAYDEHYHEHFMPTFPSGPPPVPVQVIERRIYVIRGQKVMLDSDLAELYQVPTKALNQAVKRNRKRFLKTSCSS